MGVGAHLFKVGHELESIHERHVQIAQHDIEIVLRRHRKCVHGILGDDDLRAQRGEDVPNAAADSSR
jgi:hypothetical protein